MKNIYNAKDKIFEWLGENQIKLVFSGLEAFKNDNEEFKDIISLRNRYSLLEQKQAKGTIDERDARVEHNSIIDALNTYIHMIHEDSTLEVEESEQHTSLITRRFKWRYLFIAAFIGTVVYFGFQENRFDNAFDEGMKFVFQSEYAKALVSLDKAVTAGRKNDNPLLYKALLERAKVKNKLNNPNEAIEDANNAIKLKALPEAYAARGDIWCDNKNWTNAINDYSKAIQDGTTQPYIWFNRGRALYNNRDFENAIKDFDKAINFQPNLSDQILYARALAYQAWSKKVEAVRDFNASCNQGFQKSCEWLKNNRG